MREQMLLLSLGVPWDVIQAKPAVWRKAAIILGREMREGVRYDFEADQWVPVEMSTP